MVELEVSIVVPTLQEVFEVDTGSGGDDLLEASVLLHAEHQTLTQLLDIREREEGGGEGEGGRGGGGEGGREGEEEHNNQADT